MLVRKWPQRRLSHKQSLLLRKSTRVPACTSVQGNPQPCCRERCERCRGAAQHPRAPFQLESTLRAIWSHSLQRAGTPTAPSGAQSRPPMGLTAMQEVTTPSFFLCLFCRTNWGWLRAAQSCSPQCSLCRMPPAASHGSAKELLQKGQRPWSWQQETSPTP